MSDIFVYNTADPTRRFVKESAQFKCSGYGLRELIKNLDSPVGAEIGIAEGYTSEFLLDSNEKLTLYCIDPFVNYIDWNGNNLNERDDVCHIFQNRVNRFGNRVKFIRKFSDDAISDIEDNSLDFVFIDGLHTYDQVTKDMQNYYPKLKSNGIFAGHDFTAIQCINEAVNDFAENKNKTVLKTECDVWYWYK
jgi:predicted O-methyltransferase YrrM